MERFEQLAAALRQSCPALELREREPMARHTTFRIGGPVRLMAMPRSEGEVLACLREAERAQVRLVVLGNGSNLLAADGEIPCFAVLLTGLDALERTGEREIWAGAGVSLARLASFAAQEGLAGLEFAHGIPGTLGGGVLMNAGAYGGEMVQVVKEVAAAGRSGGGRRSRRSSAGSPTAAAHFPTGSGSFWGRNFTLSRTTPPPSAAAWTIWPGGGRRSSPWSTPAPAPCSSGRRVTSPPPSSTSAA